jgi:urocanate hydratase
MPPLPNSAQERTLRTFTLLHSLRQDWGGALLIACGLNPHGAALALASNIAGAVCLSIEDNPATLKDAMRSGSCDFFVNTLDEALRAIKNEIRKHLPLSVGLQGNPTAILQELIERGVSPQLFADLAHNPAHAAAIATFRSQGTLIADLESNETNNSEATPKINAKAHLTALLHQQNWHLGIFTFSTPAAQRAFDIHALSLLPAEDHLRRRWLNAAPRILQRERPIQRLLWLTPQEQQSLA